MVGRIKRVFHKLPHRDKDCPGRVRESGYFAVPIKKVCRAYFLEAYQICFPPLHLRLRFERCVFLAFASPTRCFGLGTASEWHCMICSNMAGSFIVRYDNYFNVFVKFKG